MYYYDPNDKMPVRCAAIATATYVLALVCLFVFVSFDFGRNRPAAGDVIQVEFVDPPEPTPPQPKVKATEAPMHDELSPVENDRQVSGEDEQTRTVNPRALFKMSKGGTDDPEDVGNPKARKGDTDQAKGRGGGLNPAGNDQLDTGLQGRGLVGELPQPSYPGNESGKVVIRVTIDKSGQVTNAVYEPKGSTTSNQAMVNAAIAAARKARFTESKSFVEGGTITYKFNLK